MENRSRAELKELMEKDKIETKEALNYLKDASENYIEERGKLLVNQKLKEAKATHNELGEIYRMVANKITNDEIKESLLNFADWWVKNGETEIFIEPSLSKSRHETTQKPPEPVFSIVEPKIRLGVPIEMPQMRINETLKGTANSDIINMSEGEDE